MSLKISSCRFGEPKKKGEGLRIGTVRYLPRGVKKSELAKLDYFDVWFPTLAPSSELIKAFKDKVKAGGGGKWTEPTPKEFGWFKTRYIKELKGSPDKRHATALLAAIAKTSPITIGCYCADVDLCHRSILLEAIKKAADEG